MLRGMNQTLSVKVWLKAFNSKCFYMFILLVTDVQIVNNTSYSTKEMLTRFFGQLKNGSNVFYNNVDQIANQLQFMIAAEKI